MRYAHDDTTLLLVDPRMIRHLGNGESVPKLSRDRTLYYRDDPDTSTKPRPEITIVGVAAGPGWTCCFSRPVHLHLRKGYLGFRVKTRCSSIGCRNALATWMPAALTGQTKGPR